MFFRRLCGGRCSRGLLSCYFLFQVFLGGNSDVPVAVVAQHLVHNLRNLLLELIDKLRCIVFLMLDVAQLFLPNTCQLTAFEQFFTNDPNQFDARRSGQ